MAQQQRYVGEIVTVRYQRNDAEIRVRTHVAAIENGSAWVEDPYRVLPGCRREIRLNRTHRVQRGDHLVTPPGAPCSMRQLRTGQIVTVITERGPVFAQCHGVVQAIEDSAFFVSGNAFGDVGTDHSGNHVTKIMARGATLMPLLTRDRYTDVEWRLSTHGWCSADDGHGGHCGRSSFPDSHYRLCATHDRSLRDDLAAKYGS